MIASAFFIFFVLFLASEELLGANVDQLQQEGLVVGNKHEMLEAVLACQVELVKHTDADLLLLFFLLIFEEERTVRPNRT